MNSEFYKNLVDQSFSGTFCGKDVCNNILNSKSVELLPLLDAAFKIRKQFYGRKVKIHILNNVQNGLCKEDCQYCVKSKNSKAKIETYPMKSDEEILNLSRAD